MDRVPVPAVAPQPSAPAAPLRVAFVHAPDADLASTQNYGAKFMPVWAYVLAAHVPDDGRFAFSLYDTRFDRVEDVAEADVFLFSGINQDCGQLLATHEQLRRRFPGARTLIGGPICWSFDQGGTLDQLEPFDHVCIGDGEPVIAELLDAIRHGEPLPAVIRSETRFEIGRARPMHRGLMNGTLRRYYGAVLEVSRGCPFLCEFCDIRILPDNNRSHNLSPELIVEELDNLCRQGVRQVLLACDNFIGDPRWAEQVIDRILDWQARSGFRPGLYTWLTINLYKLPGLMRKMRQAGFDMLFIGIESFDSNALIETAKVQNAAAELVEAVRTVQSHGFIVVAGLIFGFDSDGPECFEHALDGLQRSALLSGDPSLLTALPGTPLYRRMKLAGRLRDVRFGLGGYKYQTNIRYLLPRRGMIDGFRSFVQRFCEGRYQYARLRGFFDLLEQERFVPLERDGFGSLGLFLSMLFRDRTALRQMLERLAKFARRPSNVGYALLGLSLVLRRRSVRGGFGYFQFWFFAWTNAILKYHDLDDGDFDIESVPEDFDVRDVLPAGYRETADEQIPAAKIDAQVRATRAQLEALIARRASVS